MQIRVSGLQYAYAYIGPAYVALCIHVQNACVRIHAQTLTLKQQEQNRVETKLLNLTTEHALKYKIEKI